jgi:hypothetical protein
MEAREILELCTKLRGAIALLKVARNEDKQKWDKKILRLETLESNIYNSLENTAPDQMTMFGDSIQLSPQDHELIENPLGNGDDTA